MTSVDSVRRRCWSESPRASPNNTGCAVPLGCPLELVYEILLPKTPHTIAARSCGIKLNLSWTSPWAAFTFPRDAMHTDGMERHHAWIRKSLTQLQHLRASVPACQAGYSHKCNGDMAALRWPVLSHCHWGLLQQREFMPDTYGTYGWRGLRSWDHLGMVSSCFLNLAIMPIDKCFYQSLSEMLCLQWTVVNADSWIARKTRIRMWWLSTQSETGRVHHFL